MAVFPVRRIAAALRRNDLFAVGAFETHVQVMRRDPTEVISAFDTVLSAGGERLALATASEKIVVVAGAWERHGVVAYDGLSGDELWQRRDLKLVQRLSPAVDGCFVAVAMERNSTQIVDAATGKTAMKVRAANSLWQSPEHPIALAGAYQRATLVDTRSGRRIWSAPIVGFAILDTAFSPNSVAVADAGDPGYVYWFGLDGTELWRYELGPQTLCWSMAWDEEGLEWVGLAHDVERTGPDQILRWSVSGLLNRTIQLERPVVACAFLPGGRWLVTDRDIIDSRTGAPRSYT